MPEERGGAALRAGGHVAEEPSGTQVDVLDEEGRFVTSATCIREPSTGSGQWGGALTGVEPNKRLTSGRYRLRTRTGVEAPVIVRGRQRIGTRERYPFTGTGVLPIQWE